MPCNLFTIKFVDHLKTLWLKKTSDNYPHFKDKMKKMFLDKARNLYGIESYVNDVWVCDSVCV